MLNLAISNMRSPAEPPDHGRKLGDYRLLSKFKRGGMGDIYVGYHEPLRRHVAIKTARSDGRNHGFLQSRLAAEARCLGQVSHPNVVTVHDYGRTEDGLEYLVMELLEGRGLDTIVDDQVPLSVPVVVQLITQVAEGLAAFHDEDIICADVKPDNVMVVGGPLVGRPLAKLPWIKLIDLGTARAARDPEQNLAVGGLDPILGTTWYMSPEAVMGLPLDARSDVYSIGVLMHELLTGRVPFLHDDDDVILNMHLWRKPAPLSNPGIELSAGSKLDVLCRRCLSKGPLERPCSMYELIDLLEIAYAEWIREHAPSQRGRHTLVLTDPGSRSEMNLDGGLS